ncbi:alpha/beta fold hydrolase [Algoriphagus namhaensis]|uniref:Alpha/beta fold hydrolase n=1 Tax=Algoriphagus namhaensis TaxID=915353 RepID=A0ABV8AMD7_9BACT
MTSLGFLFVTLFIQSSWIEVPLDHFDSNSRKISIEYVLNEPFDSHRKTILIHADPLDEYLGVGDLTEVQIPGFNIIRIRGRYFSSDLTNFFDDNPTITWTDKYRWLSRNQVIEDIEWIRKDILGEQPSILLGFGSGAGLVHYYLHEYPNKVEKAVSLNPLLFDVPKNLSFWDLLEGFNRLSETHSTEEIVHFSVQSSDPYFFMDKPTRDSVVENRIGIYEEAFRKKPKVKITPSLVVRSFEHYMDIGIYDLGPIGHFLRLLSKEIRDKSFGQTFENYTGTNYDLGKSYFSKMILIGGAYNLLLDPKSFDVIGEFYPNSNVFLLKDGFDFSMTRKAGIWSELLSVFCSGIIPDQIQMYSKLQGMDLLFQDRDYNSIRVGK